MQVLEGVVGLHACDAVGHETHVHLELAQRSFRIGAEGPVDAAAREPERAESRLEILDVFALELGRAQVQEPAAQGDGFLVVILAMNGLHGRFTPVRVRRAGRPPTILGYFNRFTK